VIILTSRDVSKLKLFGAVGGLTTASLAQCVPLQVFSVGTFFALVTLDGESAMYSKTRSTVNITVHYRIMTTGPELFNFDRCSEQVVQSVIVNI
jgi:hypothetical protein